MVFINVLSILVQCVGEGEVVTVSDVTSLHNVCVIAVIVTLRATRFYHEIRYFIVCLIMNFGTF